MRFPVSAGILLLAALKGGWSAPPAEAQSTPTLTCREPVAVCLVDDWRIAEASGLAASRRNPGLYYIVNDSQGQPEVYLVDRAGHVRLTIRLLGARNIDWEDLALAPGAKPETCDLCVADIGDNAGERPEVVVYRFPEPDVNSAATRTIELEPGVFRCRYEDGPHNAEGFAVHADSGDGYIFTKQWDGASRVYRLAAPWKKDGPNVLKCVGALRFPPASRPPKTMVTAADFSPDGRWLLTRSYLGGWAWALPGRTDPGGLVRALRQPPVGLELPVESQGEALCFSPDGSAVLTISEGRPTTLYETPIVTPRRPKSP